MSHHTGADSIIQALQQAGVPFVAGMPGGANLPLYDALQRAGLRHVLTRHEQAAGFIAQGVSRASDAVGVCMATSGPGAANLLTAVADAHRDSIAMLVITGQVPTSLIGTDAFQELDILRMAAPVTKASYQPKSAQDLGELVHLAIALARAGRPGPVWIDVPKDVQTAPVAAECTRPLPPVSPAEPCDEHALDRATAMLLSAKRPLLYVGGGLRGDGVVRRVTSLAEALQAPVVSSLMGLGRIPHHHPLALGMLGMHGAPYTNLCLRECDLLIALGVRFDDRATGKLSEFCPGAQVIHVDIDARELGKLRRPELAIHADAHGFVSDLLPRLSNQSRPRWLSRVRELKRLYPMPATPVDLMHPAALLNCLPPLLTARTRITTDVGQHQMWAAQCLRLHHERQLLTSGGLGTMGFGLPAAIGAALASGDPTLCITGDGSLMLSLAELATLAESSAPVKVLVLDNGQLGLVRQQQELFHGGRYSSAHFTRPPDFLAVAAALGLPARALPLNASRHAALQETLAQPGPLLIHAPVRTTDNVWPMVPPGAANHEMLLSRPVHQAGE